MAPRPRPTDDRVQAGATLGQGEVGRAGGVAIREQQPNLLGEDRIPSPGEPGGPVGAGGLGAELLRMATAEEQRLPAQPEATEQAQLRQQYTVGADERALQSTATVRRGKEGGRKGQ